MQTPSSVSSPPAPPQSVPSWRRRTSRPSVGIAVERKCLGKERSPENDEEELYREGTVAGGLKQEEDYTVSYIQWLEYKAEQEERIAKEKTGRSSSGKGFNEKNNENDQEKSRIQKGKDFLLEVLENGPMDSRILYEKARARGISRATLNRAKVLAEVHSKQQGNRSSLWKLGEWN